MKLLREFNALSYDPKVIAEQRKKNGGKVVLRGILQKADALNQNGRIYPRAILEREVENYQKFIRERRSLGECDHPDSSVIELKNVSHMVVEASMDVDGVVRGSIELLDTPAGKILQSLVESGVTLGISSRGVGSTRKQGNTDIVQDDFSIICWDMVSEPSTPNAFMMAESVDPAALRKVFNRHDRIFRSANDLLAWLNKS